MAKNQYVYLIPGFFGFANLGDLVYFSHVREFLSRILDDQGVSAEIVQVPTHPTASIRQRARRLLEVMAETAGTTDSAIHLIGHSTGGLDARLVASPGVDLGGAIEPEPVARRIRTVVTLASPHYGTPLASFFMGMSGQKLLRVFSLGTLYVLRFGHLPLGALLKVGALLTRVDGLVRRTDGLMDDLFAQLLVDFSAERRDTLAQFFTDVGTDQALMVQLMPETMDVFNAAAADRPSVRYGSVITRARPPHLSSRWQAGLSVYNQVMHSLYRWLHERAGRNTERCTALLTEEQQSALRLGYDEIPSPDANDCIVPTLSQVWGEIISAAWADHLDVVGHFDDRFHAPPHIDWLTTGSGFTREHFEALWMDVAAFIARNAAADAQARLLA